MSHPRKNPAISVEEMRAMIDYNPQTGAMYWRPRPGNNHFNAIFAEQPAGTVTEEGYLALHINRNSYKGHQIAWALMTGEWPQTKLRMKDGNKLNLKWENIELWKAFAKEKAA